MTNQILSIELPWPDKRLSPNARVHHMAKAEAAKTAREVAGYKAWGEWFALNGGDETTIKIESRRYFYPPDKRHRDVDNLGAMCKAYQDGVFDALEADDSQIVRVINEMREVVKGGKVVMELWRLSPSDGLEE